MLNILPYLSFFGCAEDLPVSSPEMQEETFLFTERYDFGADGHDDWFALNDDVMGGVSVGEVLMTDETLIFEGAVSTNNNGGFVSLRSPTETYDFSDFTQVEISYRAEGHDFKMIMPDRQAWYMPKFEHEVIVPSSGWTTTTVDLYDFVQTTMTGYGDAETGVEMSEAYLSEVIRLEFINSEFESGAFRLELDYIEFQAVRE